MASKANSTHGVLTSSTLVVNVWFSMESFHLLSPSRLEGLKAVGPVLILIFINDFSDSLENPLYLFGDDSTICHDIPHPSDRWTAASSLSSDLENKNKNQP